MDKLSQIIESYLLHHSFESSDDFIEEVANHYLEFLEKRGHIPFSLRSQTRSYLEEEVQELLIKRMYGVVPGQRWGEVSSLLDEALSSFCKGEKKGSSGKGEEGFS